MKDLQKIKEFFSKPMNEGNKEYFKPLIRKNKSNPNFLYVDILYPVGTGFTTALGSKTMLGQDKEENAAKALAMGNAIAKKLQVKYDLEDIDVSDLENGKVEVFAVSDDFIKIDSPSLDEAKISHIVGGIPYKRTRKSKEDKIEIFQKLDEPTKIKLIKKFKEKNWEVNPNEKGGLTATKKLMSIPEEMDINDKANGFKSGKEFINIKLQKYPKAVSKINQLINMIGESNFTMEMAEWIFDFFNNASYESPMNEAKSSYFKIGDIVELKNMPENLPYEIRNGIVDNKWEIIKVSKSGRSMYSDVMEDVFGYDIELLDKKLKYKMFVYPEDVKSSMNEAKSEDKVDTITMDIPLFLRMLEYSREDASQDMDLHDVTEKSNLLGKERGILSMEDYEEIVGSAEDTPEKELNEANVPSNIRDFAKRKGVSSLVNKVAGWAEKVGARIAGGTAVGMNYATLVLDLDYKQQGEIRINTDNETIKLYDEPVDNFNAFQRVYVDYKDLDENVAPNHDGKAAPYGSGYKPLEEKIAKALDKINEELCPAGKAYRKRRIAAGEKSSAYLSGRAVKVCKGQMSGKAKKK
jgi:hypothetical protein